MKLIPLFAVICFLSTSLYAQNNDATLTKMIITFRTHGDNKDYDTKFSVKIKNKVNLWLSEEIAYGNNLGGAMEFVNPSNHSFNLTLSSSTIRVKDLTVPFLSIEIHPIDNDRWVFDYLIRLEFSDGKIYSTESQHGLILDQDNNRYEAMFKS